MMRASKEVLQAAIMGFVIPMIILTAVILLYLPGRTESVPSTDPTATTVPTESIMQQKPQSMQLDILMDGVEMKIDLEEYVLGVVLSEMPASFQLEALKAQAVAARTYALLICSDGSKHAGAICNRHSCCQGYMTREDYLQLGWSERYIERVRGAVDATAGQVLTFEGELIRSPYFSCSGGATEAAITVWGRDYPYLQSVESPGEEETVYYTHSKVYTFDQFQETLGVSLSGTPASWFGEITYTTGGGIQTMVIGGVEYRGTTLRSLLALRSTVFQVVVTENAICFETKGYGHRVGMSQYGAEAMAKEGSAYTQILSHYYVGTSLIDVSGLQLP